MVSKILIYKNLFKRKKSLNRDIYCYRDIHFSYCDIRFWSYRPPLVFIISISLARQQNITSRSRETHQISSHTYKQCIL